MKFLVIPHLFLIITAASQSEERIVPLDDFHLIVGISATPTKIEDLLQRRFSVSACISRSKFGVPEEQSTSVEVWADDWLFTGTGLDTLREAALAAREGRAFRRDVECGIDDEPMKITLESHKTDDLWLLRLIHRDEPRDYLPAALQSLQKDLDAADASRKWYEKLLGNGAMPEPADPVHPPVASNFRLTALVGGTGKMEEIMFYYELEKSNDSEPRRLKVTEMMTHAVDGEPGMGGCMGEQARIGMEELRAALVALREGREHSTPKEGRQGFKATTDLNKGEVLLTYSLDGDRQVESRFAAGQLDVLDDMTNRMNAAVKWITNYERLIYRTEDE